jgi:pimeloyl-ACP methyl ester carboxylesterase
VTSRPYFETDDLQALLRHLRVKHAMLVGSSHGGALAINFTLEHADVVGDQDIPDVRAHAGVIENGIPNSGAWSWKTPDT